MSASLVGSEMCIRDRLCPPPDARSPAEAMQRAFLEPAARASPRVCAFVPVSYTHLTLPTICSV
eukprot:6116490-Alexandrium_andersonii.AAC.1